VQSRPTERRIARGRLYSRKNPAIGSSAAGLNDILLISGPCSLRLILRRVQMLAPAISMFTGVMILLCSAFACAQSYPTKPIRIVTSVAGGGGGGDVLARIVGSSISGPLGQPVILDNRTNIALAEIVAKAPPDGYTTLLVGDVLWVGPLLRGQTNPLQDFAPISMLDSAPQILVVHPSFPASSVKELIAMAKAKPGVLNYASGPAGTTNHLAAELFKYMAGVSITRIRYQGGAPAIAALGWVWTGARTRAHRLP
jgi:tripartite-type tricarboxylate transporter receptor subunit TctC